MNGHKAAYEAWFSRFEIERKRRKISAGRSVPGFPPPPPGPAEVNRVIWNSINPLGEHRAAQLCNVHRTTVTRWLSGAVQIPIPAYALLRFHAEGVPPGCGEAWLGFQFGTEGLTCPDGKTSLSAREIAGTAYLRAYTSMLEQKVSTLETLLADALRRIDFGSANDPFTHSHDPRSKAFSIQL